MQLNDREPRPGVVDPWDTLPDGVMHLDRRWRITYLNSPAEDMLGRSADAVLQRDVRECFPAIVGTPFEVVCAEVLLDGVPRVFDYLHQPWEHWFEIRAYPDSEGLTVFVRDIDERRRTEQARDAEMRQLAAVLESLPTATVLVDEDDSILSANGTWRRNGELLRQQGLGPSALGDDYLEAMRAAVPAEDHRALVAGLRRLREEDQRTDPPGTFDHEYSSPLGDGQRWFRVQACRVRGSRRIVVSHVDVTEQVREEQALAWRARHDELTGLPNRSTLIELIDDALQRALAGEGSVALLVLDLDGFKTINDSLGHQIGDALLRQVGERLLEQVRPGDPVARLGGDQFVVLARSCDDAEAAALAFRLQSAFSATFTVAGITVPLSASIGVAVSRPDVRDAHQLLSDADSAMFAAKSSGRDRVHLFSLALRQAARWRLEVAARLHDDAIDQLVVHYQPVVRLDTGAVEGVEALVRWQHPERGLLPPDSFLGVAEETGQVIPITRWLLHETTRQAAAWAAEGLPLRMSVNVSARHFAAETLVRDVRAALRESGLPPDQLVLELTETSIAEDPTRAEDQLTVLRSFGVRVAIDDFGTGWSSLAQLFALPIGTLKIDRSLLAAAERAATGESGAVLAAIVGLSRTLGISSVAEGIETAEHLRMVRAAGCDLAQGWLLGQPMPAEAVPGWIRGVQAAGGDLCALATADRAASGVG